MPLAIELSAAWLHILNVCEIIEELEKGIDILSTEVRDTPLRHRSIRAVFDHSWSMLHSTEQKILMMLSVFRGGFTRETAQKVTGASLQKLAGLSNKSFLSHDANSGRLEVHELLRQYGREQLDNSTEDSASAQEAHAAYYAEFIQERWQHLQDRRQMLAHAEIETDIENVRVAWQYYLGQRNVSQMWKLIFGLWQVYWLHGWNLAGKELYSEAVRVLQSEDKDENTHLKALAQALQAYFLAWLGQAEQGYELANESVAVLRKLDHPKALCCAYESLILNSYFLNRIVEETEAKNNFHEIALKIDDKRFLTLSFYVASMVALIKEDFTEAGQLAESGLDITKETGDLINSTFPLIAWGHVAFARGNYEDARNYFERCLKVSEEVGFRWAIANSRKYLSKVALLMDNTAEAEKHLIQSLRITKEIGFVRDVVNILYDYACLCVAQGFPEQAVELLVLVSQHPTSPQFRWLEGRIRDSAQNLLGNLENELSLETFAIAVERGQKLVMDEVIADLIGSKGRK
jgi:tetratricopeptide (TPR) repeat protein